MHANDPQVSRRDILTGAVSFPIVKALCDRTPHEPVLTGLADLQMLTEEALACAEQVFPERHSIQFFDLSPVIQLGIVLGRLEARVASLSERGVTGEAFMKFMKECQVTKIDRLSSGMTSVNTNDIDGKTLRGVLADLGEQVKSLVTVQRT